MEKKVISEQVKRNKNNDDKSKAKTQNSGISARTEKTKTRKQKALPQIHLKIITDFNCLICYLFFFSLFVPKLVSFLFLFDFRYFGLICDHFRSLNLNFGS